MWNVLSTNVSRAVWAVLLGACLPIVASAGTINIILSDVDVVYSGANFGGSVYDVVGHRGGNLNPAEADNIKTAVFEMDMASVGAVMSGDAGFGQMHPDMKIDGVGNSLNSLPAPPGANFHPGIGSNGGGFGLDWFTTVGGYKLHVVEGDLRQSINVIAPGGKEHELRLWEHFGAFSAVGPKAEWRMKGRSPFALIFRFNVSENPEDSSKTTSYLIVAKVSPSLACVTEIIKPSRNQNAEARRAADRSATVPCKIAE